MGEGCVLLDYQTMSISRIKGDRHDQLTSALAKEISLSGPLRFRQRDADLSLEVTILDMDEEDIGFRYDRHKDGKRERNTIPIETRITAAVEVQLLDCRTGKILFGPAKIYSGVDFDHNYYFGSDSLNRISLGQVTDIDAARDSVRIPLFEELAKNIVQTLTNSF